MIPGFDLSRLNVHSPYTVWQDGDALLFRTRYGILFAVEFDSETFIADAYWLNLYNRNHRNSPGDSDVRDTIICIIEEFFRAAPNIMLYMCETGDERQSMRARLFTRWFNNSDIGHRFVIKTAILKDENVDNYIAIIVEKANPHCAEVIASFEEQVKLFRENK